ncbi:TIGR03032 family protein [Planctomicrobium piriforme]|nr:TIGR03032 family protein [Planctomicrobium piriforme]
MTSIPPSSPPTAEPWLKVSASPGFIGWLQAQQVSLAFTTYQAGKLFLLGRNQENSLSLVERTFNRCMGLWCNGQTLWMSSVYQVWRFENALAPGESYQGYDRLYVPRIAYTTGDLDIHDIAVDHQDRLVFVNTRFSCLGTFSPTASFAPLWKPAHISSLAPEDRCHLNGLAMAQGVPRYVTCASQSDVVEGWRAQRTDGGCVIEVTSGQIVVAGLSMPHSPRLYGDRLWLLNSGTGEFGWVNLQQGRFVPMTFCPGYLRGLAFVGDTAVIGLSRPRYNKTFSGLALDDRLVQKGMDSQCGLIIVDLHSGNIVESLSIEGDVRELYDVIVIPGAVRPTAFGLKSDEIQRLLTIGESDDL